MRDTTRGKLTHGMAALNRLMGLGVGIAVAGAVVKSTLYNGKLPRCYKSHHLIAQVRLLVEKLHGCCNAMRNFP